ncbi:MAG: RES family NAD+ phosphorylase, partial [Flavobacteriaceae bacterium]
TNWRGHPPLELTQKIGDGFIRENKHLALRVPSAIVVGEYNYLINPLHTDFNKVTIVQTELFGFDQRLFNPNQG